MATDWKLKGYLLGACSCDWGCPCSFDARPTRGFCEGGYTWHVTEGSFDRVKLDGFSFSWLGHSPGPLHEGNVNTVAVVDDRADREQRKVLLDLLMGRSGGGPWAVFASLVSKWFDPVFARYDVRIDGLNSKLKAGNILELQLSKIFNPVTGNPEELKLLKPTGLTSLWIDLGKSTTFKLSTPGLAFDHSGQYGEFSEFHYTPAGLK